ncbi:conserved exported protein of unknown function [Tepidanaerobacter acetatoxydans Re1]|uniref:Uncharacterized protein n=1 Tax=Tepidanaerobacter acetatoxydans (strain DSM 21804 / JCM 16047 / Re1) TaxID=1209989 RepID=F4LU42_TEPAE|nr:hypothetical protein [Tepidanaerobacter acetatoxydans]AEE90568.1 hypothetical protein TepRe1_0365 [Tepidanaerobacter acetatoxydans Re1]CCP25084.1 conserved exported protein of unknown function [Tepidanaerobacter acetatoxydans Re1]
MLKKMLTILLSVIMTMSMGSAAFAAEQLNNINNVSKPVTMSMDELINYLNSIDFGSDITFAPLMQTKSSNQDLITFDSLYEVEIYFKELLVKRAETTQFGQSKPQSENHTTRANTANTGWYTNTCWWWGGGNTSLLSRTNAEVRFYYNNGVASNISVTDSYMTGIVGATWTHRSGSATSKGGINAVIKVTETWLIGLDIWGFPVGASFNETLTSPTLSVR